MCGLWASVGLSACPAMLEAVRSRGPDGEGWFEAPTPAGILLLAFRRLAIYDLSSAGDQPISLRRDVLDPGLHLVFNGAIYNFLQIKAELQDLGYRFRSRTDSEVLLSAWDCWGRSALARLEGMFAIILFDARRQRLFLARDRFGEKPLFWTRWSEGGGGFACASDLRQLIAATPVGRRANLSAVADFLNVGLVDHRGEETFFAGMHRIPAGSCAEIPLEPGPIGAPVCSHWDTASDPLEAPLLDRLRTSVDLRMQADVPSGFCLSGGLDSSLLYALGKHRLTSPPASVTGLYDEVDLSGQSLSERPYLDAVLGDQTQNASLISPTADEVLQQFDTVVETQGEPFSHSSICLQWFVFREASRRGLRVMLDGQGADELFGGYDPMSYYYLADQLGHADLFGFWNSVQALAADGSSQTVRGLVKGAALAYMPEHLRRKVARLRGRFPPKTWLMPAVEPPVIAPEARTRYGSMTSSLVGATSLPSLLRYADRNSMGHSVESRLPYLAPAIADYALALPAAAKFHNGWTKEPLRRAAEGIVPPKVVRRRRKLGFVTPQDVWLAGPWRDWARERLADASSRFETMINEGALAELRKRDFASAETNAAAFRLIVLTSWAERLGVGF